jgi:hypothetical protein
MSFDDLMEVFWDMKRKHFSAMIFEASLSEINWEKFGEMLEVIRKM